MYLFNKPFNSTVIDHDCRALLYKLISNYASSVQTNGIRKISNILDANDQCKR